MEVSSNPHFLTPQPSPWLVYFSIAADEATQPLYSTDRQEFDTKSIPAIHGKRCYGFSQGWLFMADFEWVDCFLFNPISTLKIELPQLPSEFKESLFEYILSLPPYNPDSLLLLFHCLKQSYVYCHPGDNEWIFKNYKLNDEEDDDKELFRKKKDDGKELVTDLEVCNGTVYAYTSHCKLAIIDLVPHPSVRRWECDRKAFQLFLLFNKVRLVESLGELYLVHRAYDIIIPKANAINKRKNVIGFAVLKLDFSDRKWVEVNHIQGMAFFLSPSGRATSCSSLGSNWVKRDSIYFIEDDHCTLYRYDMVDESITAEMELRTLHWHEPFWVMAQENP